MIGRRFRIEIDCTRGALAIGGYSATPTGIQAGFAADERGRPLIPATAVRGALRLSLEALLRAKGEVVCSGGDGTDPVSDRRSGSNAETGCTLKDGAPCTACQLFGAGRRGIADGQRTFAALIIGDAKLPDGIPTPRLAIRPAVAIARKERSAETDRLFHRLAPLPSQEQLVLVAEGRLIPLEEKLSEKDATARLEERWKLLNAAVIATRHIGSGTSRGQGRVDMTIRPIEGPDPSSSSAAKSAAIAPNTVDLRLRIRLDSPASIGIPLAIDNQRDTRTDIPGSALRGAIGFGLAESLPDPSVRSFQDLVDEHHGAIFDFLYPVDDGAPPAGWRVPAPWPRTARGCKYYPPQRGGDESHGFHDSLIDQIAVRLANEGSDAIRRQVLEHLPPRCTVKLGDNRTCNATLEPLDGTRMMRGSVPTRLVTRLRLGRSENSAADGALFSHVLIGKGQKFEGSIRGVPAGSLSHLKDDLASLSLAIGRGRFRGWGRFHIERLEPAPPPPLLSDRAAAFDKALERRLQSLGFAGDAIPRGRLVVLTLLSPLLIGDAQDADRATLRAALGGDEPLEWLLAARRFSVERGWSQRPVNGRAAGARPARRSVLAGGVFVAQVASESARQRLFDRIDALERQGVPQEYGAGDARRLGFGRVIAFDPFHVDHARP